MNGTVRVVLWGTTIGYLGYSPGQSEYATFEYDPRFMQSGIQISPVHMLYPPSRFLFDQLNIRSFKGIPGIIADSLPDAYGNQLIDIYMADKGIPASDVTTLDRLLYVANRSMGALEYEPGEKLPLYRGAFDIQELSDLAEMVINRSTALHEKLDSTESRSAALSLIRVGSSVGGARSKALVAVSSHGKILDGTVNHGPGYRYWILKFDSGNNRDLDGADPKGMPAVEYVYSIIARRAGIEMPATELLQNGEEKHFLIERFDRIIRNNKLDKLHYASWAGLAHADRDGTNSYEQLILLIRRLKLGQAAETEIFRRAVFNVLGRNQDDHTKNMGFLMDRKGKWRLAPAFDMTYSYDPQGKCTRNHQCMLQSKNNDFDLNDLIAFGAYCNLNRKNSIEIIRRVYEAFKEFSALAEEHGVPEELKRTVLGNFRLEIFEL